MSSKKDECIVMPKEKDNMKVRFAEQSFPISLLTFSSDKPFDQVLSDFEKQLGRFDESQASKAADFASYVRRMEGSSGLMILGTFDMSNLPALAASSTRARQYLVGNPLIASELASHNTLTALYAPIRVLIFTHEGRTCISYDQPSTTFGRFRSNNILRTAQDDDEKYETLARNSL